MSHSFKMVVQLTLKLAPLAVGDLAIVSSMNEAPKLRVVSEVTGEHVSLIDFGDEDGTIRFLKDRVVAVA